MATTRTNKSFLAELAFFLADGPTAKELVDYHPSRPVQRRARLLLEKQSGGLLSPVEDRELDEFAFAEHLMRLIKARVRSKRTTP